MKLIVLGLPASGKSSALNELKKKEFKIINADKIVEKIYRNKKVIELLAFNFGLKIIKENEINKKKLSEIVFKNKQKLNKLSKLIHPLVLIELKKEIQKIKSKNIAFEVPVLIKEFEKPFLNLSNGIVLIEAKKELRFNRLKEKYGLKEAKKRIKLITFNKKRILNSGIKVFKVNGLNFNKIKEDINKIID
jgi:dephospho-CoA kinase